MEKGLSGLFLLPVAVAPMAGAAGRIPVRLRRVGAHVVSMAVFTNMVACAPDRAAA